MDNSIWRKIDFGSGRYSVSSLGRVRNDETFKFMSTQIQNSGYQIVHLNFKGKRKAFTIHRLVAIAFIAKVVGKDYVDHKDGNKLNNAYTNLRWATASENSTYAFEAGIMDNSKLKAASRMKDIGARFGFDNSQTNLIHAKSIEIVVDSQVHQFRSVRQAAKHLKIAHKTLANRLSKGMYK
jgi:hypothetical protein